MPPCRLELSCRWLPTAMDDVAHARGQRCTRSWTTLHTAVSNARQGFAWGNGCAKKQEEARLAAIKAQEEAERAAKEEIEKASAIVQEEDPSVIPVHSEPVVEEPVVEVESEPVDVKEPSAVEGFDISRDKKNKKRGDFRR